MTLVIAHRGASAYRPENTLPAFAEAVQMGADGIELDVHATADGTLLVHHDPDVGGFSIPRSALSTIQDSVPQAPPTLSAAFETIGAATTVYIELKTLDARWDDALFADVDAAPNPNRCQVHAFDHRIVHRVLHKRSQMRGGILSASYPLDPVRPVLEAGARTLWQQGSLIDEALVERVHNANCSIIAWTVDDERQMRYLQSIGVDGICSNKPDVAGEVLR